jgi:hypothetical protein
MTSTVQAVRENIQPWSCCIDLVIARTILTASPPFDINNLLTKSEGSTGKYPTEVLLY